MTRILVSACLLFSTIQPAFAQVRSLPAGEPVGVIGAAPVQPFSAASFSAPSMAVLSTFSGSLTTLKPLTSLKAAPAEAKPRRPQASLVQLEGKVAPLAARQPLAASAVLDRVFSGAASLSATDGFATDEEGHPLAVPTGLWPLTPPESDKANWTHGNNLHNHSHYSDGVLAPAQVVRLEYDKGVRKFAMTDHDSVDGVLEALSEVKKINAEHPTDPMELYVGVELSAAGGGIHINALGVDVTNPELIRVLKHNRDGRVERAKAIIKSLNDLPELKEKGIVVTLEEVVAKTKNGLITEPHIAEVLVDKGLVKNRDDAFGKYLKHGHESDQDDYFATPEEVIAAVKAAGGVAFLNHPYTVVGGLKKVKELLELGLAGLEAYRPSHATSEEGKAKQERRLKAYLAMIDELGLVASVGSDFHDPKGHLRDLTVLMPKNQSAKLMKLLGEGNKASLQRLESLLGSRRSNVAAAGVPAPQAPKPDIAALKAESKRLGRQSYGMALSGAMTFAGAGFLFFIHPYVMIAAILGGFYEIAMAVKLSSKQAALDQRIRALEASAFLAGLVESFEAYEASQKPREDGPSNGLSANEPGGRYTDFVGRAKVFGRSAGQAMAEHPVATFFAALSMAGTLAALGIAGAPLFAFAVAVPTMGYTAVRGLQTDHPVATFFQLGLLGGYFEHAVQAANYLPVPWLLPAAAGAAIALWSFRNDSPVLGWFLNLIVLGMFASIFLHLPF